MKAILDRHLLAGLESISLSPIESARFNFFSDAARAQTIINFKSIRVLVAQEEYKCAIHLAGVVGTEDWSSALPVQNGARRKT